MNYFNKIFSVFIFLFLLVSCLDSDNSIQQEDENPPVSTLKGILITNEGNFGSANASIDFLKEDGELLKNVFHKANPKVILGDVLQGSLVDENYIYIVMNNSNKVEILDKKTFKIVTTITENLHLPRYIATTSDYLFVTNNYSTYAGQSKGYITVYEKENYQYVTKIELPQQVEKIYSQPPYVYVQQSYFSDGNKVTKIDAKTFQVVKDIVLEQGLRDISWGVGQYFYAVSNTDTNCDGFIDCTEDLDVQLYQINKNSGDVEKTWTVHQYVTNIDHYTDDVIFYTTNNQIFSLNTTSETNTPQSIYQTAKTHWSNFYGFSVIEDKVYFSDVNGFIAASDIYILNQKGTLLNTFVGGRGVNDFYLFK